MQAASAWKTPGKNYISRRPKIPKIVGCILFNPFPKIITIEEYANAKWKSKSTVIQNHYIGIIFINHSLSLTFF